MANQYQPIFNINRCQPSYNYLMIEEIFSACSPLRNNLKTCHIPEYSNIGNG